MAANLNAKIVICWIISHSDIIENVLANSAAKEAIEMPILPGIQIPSKDMYRFL